MQVEDAHLRAWVGVHTAELAIKIVMRPLPASGLRGRTVLTTIAG
jgi:hypothetical protein